jgi:hypothetical protein
MVDAPIRRVALRTACPRCRPTPMASPKGQSVRTAIWIRRRIRGIAPALAWCRVASRLCQADAARQAETDAERFRRACSPQCVRVVSRQHRRFEPPDTRPSRTARYTRGQRQDSSGASVSRPPHRRARRDTTPALGTDRDPRSMVTGRRMRLRPSAGPRLAIRYGVQMCDGPSPASVSSRSLSRLTNAAGSSSCPPSASIA